MIQIPLKPDKYLLILIYLGLAIIAGLRFRVGVDTVMYEEQLSCIKPFLTRDFIPHFTFLRFGPALTLLTSLSRIFTPSLWPVQLLIALWVNLSICRFSLRYAGLAWLFLPLYLLTQYLNFNFEVMREGAAVAAILWVYDAMQGGRWKRVALFSIIALSFHLSAIVPIGLIVGWRMVGCHFGPKWLSGYACGCALLIAVGVGVLLPDFAYSYLPSCSWIPDILIRHILRYAEEYGGEYLLNPLGVAGRLLQFGVLPAVAFFILRRSGNPKVRELIPPVFMGLLILSVGVNFQPLYRLFNYFAPFTLAIVCQCVKVVWARRRLRWWIVAAMLPWLAICVRNQTEISDGRLALPPAYWPYHTVAYTDRCESTTLATE